MMFFLALAVVGVVFVIEDVVVAVAEDVVVAVVEAFVISLFVSCLFL